MYDVRCLWPAFLLIAVAATARPLPAAPPRTIAVDVLVVGATPAGIAAAAAAARTGARVHLVEALPKMGGVITWARLTTWDMNLTPEGSHLTRGIFWEYYQALGLSFDLEEAINKLTWHVYRERLVGSTTNAPLSKVLIENGRAGGAAGRPPPPPAAPRPGAAPARSSTPPTTRTWPPPPACPSCSAAPARAASPGCRRRGWSSASPTGDGQDRR